MTEAKKTKAAKAAAANVLGIDQIRDHFLREPIDVEALLKSPAIRSHVHFDTAKWCLKHAFLAARGGSNSSIIESFEYALANNGRLQRGILLGSHEHAAALSGAALWRYFNPSSAKGGPGRGQGRKAVDGCTGLSRITVTLRENQRKEFKALGGSAWLRQQIDLEVGKRKN